MRIPTVKVCNNLKERKRHVVVLSPPRVQLFLTPWTAAYSFPCPSPFPRACSNSCALSQWCHPAILFSVVPCSSYLQSFPASGSFLLSQLFASGGQSIGASASASVLQVNIQDWFPLGLTGLISLQSKGLSVLLYLIQRDSKDCKSLEIRSICSRVCIQVVVLFLILFNPLCF